MKKIIKLILSVIFLYGIFLALVKAVQALSPATTSENIANACSLETSIPNLEACRDGFKSTASLISNLTKNGVLEACGSQFPDFRQLNAVCKEYYDNSSLTGSCLNGMVSGASSKLTETAIDCAVATRDNIVAATSVFAVACASLLYHHAAQTETAQNLSDKVFGSEESGENRLLI